MKPKKIALFIIPLVYISAFLFAIKQLVNRNKQGIFIFLIFGLPIYITSLSVALQSGMKNLIPIMQPMKELLILVALGISVWELKRRFRPQPIDYVILAYFAYTLLYVFLPIGTLTIPEKAVSFKSTTFFVFVYFTGRIIGLSEIYISKYFQFFLLVIIAASAVLLLEIATSQHLQSSTGYADFLFYYYNQEPEGNYGLSWTFETSTGLKRFASFFANPIEFGAATLVSLSIIAGLYTTDNYKFKPNLIGIVAIVATQFSILFALSRASLASYVIMIYVYALVTKNKFILRTFYFAIVAAVVYFMFFLLILHPDLYEFIYETITFTNPSSVGHIIAWLEGIDAIIKHPLGMGLGASGVLATTAGGGTGGENQYIITGVQTGVIGLGLYLAAHIYLIKTCWAWYPKLNGKNKTICLTVLLIQIGVIIPMLTSELESSAYISYVSWLLAGLFMNVVAQQKSLIAKALKINPEIQLID